LSENTHMLELGKKVGFNLKYKREEGTYDLTIDLPEALLNAND
jgi:hypothetical protein